MSWISKEGHTQDASGNIRTSNGSGCPYYSTQKVWTGFNDLQTKFPEIAKEANSWVKVDVTDAQNEREIHEIESKFKKWLKQNIGLVPEKNLQI